ncbi:MAG: oxygen-insensitive NADPH nitroreductase, partial [Sedimenticolaceae bacterium]
PQVVVDQLALPALVTPLFGMCLGWPNESNEVKPRMPVGFVLHQDSYQEVSSERIALYDEKMAAYYASRGSNIKLSDWSNAVATAMQGKKREHMLDFLHSRGFFLR